MFGVAGFLLVCCFLMLCKNFLWCLCVWKMFLLDVHVFCYVDFFVANKVKFIYAITLLLYCIF